MTDTVPKTAKRPQPKGGSRKGIPNKATKALKDMILQALDETGGVEYLVRQAKKKNPAPFMALLAKVLPLQIAGDANAPITVQVVTLTSSDEQAKAWRPPT